MSFFSTPAAAPEPYPVPGWFGKLPSLGDFAQRRLTQDFVDAWDHWLASGLGDWMAQDPNGWEVDFTAGASWHFLLLPGLWSWQQDALIGCLLPSVDNVGRRFPLTLAQPLTRWPQSMRQAQALRQWLDQLGDLGHDALERQWSPAELEDELQALGGAMDAFEAVLGRDGSAAWTLADAASCLLQGHASSLEQAPDDLVVPGRGSSLWLGHDDRGVPRWQLWQGPLQPEKLRLLLRPA